MRDGEGESTGNGQTYTLRAGQRGTFSGTDSLRAEVDDIGGPDEFDNWSRSRDRRYDDSRSAHYVSPEVVGYEDLDEYGDWRDDSNYGHVWFPNRVAAGWAPYHEGHWDWISPWGWTWVDDAPWGYAPFHYGRWIAVGGRWGWVAGPVAVRPVYAPALVVFIGGGGGWGGNVGWFALGPREVYVPSYRVSRVYVDRVNISNTTVNVTNITNVYNTTIVNKTTNITNVTYVNRNVQGAVTAVPQHAFVSAQPVGKARIAINERDIAAAPLSTRVAVAPTRESVMGGRANTVNRVTAPPEHIANRAVIAKVAPPPPPVSFAKQQTALAQHPGEPLAKHEVQSLRPASEPESHPMVKVAPPGKPATPNIGRPGNQPNQPGNQPQAERPDQRPGQPVTPPPANHPGAVAPNQPGGTAVNPPENRPSNQSRPNDRPSNDRPGNGRPGAASPPPPDRPRTVQPNQPMPPPANRPESVRPEANRPTEPPVKNDHPPTAQPDRHPNMNPPNDRRETTRPDLVEPKQPTNRPEAPASNDRPPNARPNNRPEPPARNDREPAAQPPPARNDRPPDARPNNRPEPPAENRAARPGEQPPKPQTPEEKKQKQEQQKRDEKPPN